MKPTTIFNSTLSFGKLLVLFCMLLAAACTPDDLPPPCIEDCCEPPCGGPVIGEGISEEDLETYAGDMGLVLGARPIAKKGYQPATMVVTVQANSGDFSQTLEVDPYTVLAQIKLPIEDLSDEAQDELREGVGIDVEILDPSGSPIWEETFSKISFRSNPQPTMILADDLEDLNTEVHLKSNTPYYIQIVEDEIPVNKAISGELNFFSLDYALYEDDSVKFSGSNETQYHFSFEAIPGTTNTFAIKYIESDKYLSINRRFGVLEPTLITANLSEFPVNNIDAHFVVEKESDGVYYLQSIEGERVKSSDRGFRLEGAGATDVTVRFIPMNIVWAVESIETRFLEPILPPAQNSFSYNSTLTNCGQGELSQTIGSSMTVETVTTVGWEETISTSSTHSAGGSITMGVEVSGSFFGNGATYSAEAKANYNYTTDSGTENTKWEEATGSTSQTFFSERTIIVPPKSASLAYDAFQSYDNIKVNVVQRLRVRATEHDTGEALTGEEISTQFHFNGFNGLITETGSDYIEVTLRGVATMDKIFDSQSEVKEVPPNCGAIASTSQSN